MSAPAGTAAGPGPTPLDLPLDRGATTFIEASAGTGKTHALTTLVTRLVIEEDWPLDRILVVTFTRAATAELRDRIRRVLGATLAAVRARDPAAPHRFPTSGSGNPAPQPESRTRAPAARADAAVDAAASGENGIDPQAGELLAAWERRGGAVDPVLARRLEAAMRDIDRANIHTIHGFCQRVLADHAFECGFPFGFEVSGGDGETVAAAVRDFWRRRLYPASLLLTRYAVDSGFLPAKLTAWVSARRAKTGVSVRGGDPLPEPIEACEAAWREEFDAVRAMWEQAGVGFLAELRDGPWLNRSRYRRSRTDSELAAIDALFAAPEPWLPKEGVLARYGRELLSDAIKRRFELPNLPLFDAFDRLEEAGVAFRAACDQWLRWHRRELLSEVRESIRRRVQDDRRLAYDDLLIELDGALGGAQGERLAERIRRAYPCALVDEYQDTDPVQTQIFSRIYGEIRLGSGDARAPRRPGARTGHGGAGPSLPGESSRPGPFIVVGDPKQSIYRFRGADVFAYLAARRAAHDRLHLDRNWRSVPALVEAVNAVFADDVPFVTPEIEYRAVSAAGERQGALRIRLGEPGESGKLGESGKSAESGGCSEGLELWLIPRSDDGKALTKSRAHPVVAAATADEIGRLLELGARGAAAIGDVPLTGGDIAVLVRTREQGRMIADALRQRRVRSIEIDDGSVFHTREAEQLERLLWALAEPGRESGVRGALAGDLFGLDARALLALGDDEDAWSEWIERLADWRRHWEARGIGSVLLRLLEREEGALRLLGQHDGARRLTNYRHLAEVLQEAETRERLAPAELAVWLNHRRSESDRRDDAMQLRLESDEHLVKILTMHGAKGLEFPVVFCPFAWDARGPRRRADSVDAMYHLGRADDYREVLDLNPDERAVALEWAEEFAESVRLLYVALTRAMYRCVVAWGQVSGARHAPFAWLLHRLSAATAETAQPPDGEPQDGEAQDGEPHDGEPQDGEPESNPGATRRGATDAVSQDGWDRPGHAAAAPRSGSGAGGPEVAAAALRAVADRFTDLSASAWLDEVRAFAARLPNAVSVTELDPASSPVCAPDMSEDSPRELAALDLVRPLRRVRGLTSFSALRAEDPAAAGRPGPSRPNRDDAYVDRPDHDQGEVPLDTAGDETDVSGGGSGDERSALTFPRGPVAGSCLHRIFERLDTPPEPGQAIPGVEATCSEALEDFGIDGEWNQIARDMVERTRAVHLHELDRVEPGREHQPPGNDGASGTAPAHQADTFRLADPLARLVELEFHFPVDGLDRHRLAAVLVEHGYPDPFAWPGPRATSTTAPPIHGYLRGFIDLVVEHAGRWYVVDYKSNWLGPTPGNYGPDALDAAMQSGGYALQSLIYLVALHRYLATRLPEYDPERHVGGAFYLFVRGIDPAAGMRRGVHFDRPSAACLAALDGCFGGGGA